MIFEVQILSGVRPHRSAPIAAERQSIEARRAPWAKIAKRIALAITGFSIGFVASEVPATPPDPPSWVTPASWQADAAGRNRSDAGIPQFDRPPRAGSAATSPTAVRFEHIDDQTVWTVQTLKTATVSGANVRLRDVARLVGIEHRGWDRISEHVLAIVPENGTTISLDRDRVAQLIEMLPASPRHFRWIGAEKVSVTRQDVRVRDAVANRPSEKSRNAGTSSLTPHGDVAVSSWSEEPMLPATQTETLAIANGAEERRLRQALRTHLERAEPEILRWGSIVALRWPEAFSNCVSIASIQWLRGDVLPWAHNDSGYARSSDASGDAPVQTVVAIAAARMPQGRFGGGGIREVVFELDVQAHPLGWTMARAVGREHVLRREDLRLEPVPVATSSGPFSSVGRTTEWVRSEREVDFWIGKRTLTSLRRGQPLQDSLVGKPRWVHRGESVEVRSETAGIVVTTVGRCLEDGGEDDWVEIETLSPRKRLTAQVVGAGIVRVLARSPRIHSIDPAKAVKP